MSETMQTAAENRWQQIRKIQKNNINPYTTLFVLIFLAGLFVGSLSQSAFDNPAGVDGSWYSGFWQNFSTEMIGAIITFIFFTGILGRQEEERRRKDQIELNQQLQNFIQQLNHDADERAIEEAKKRLLAQARSRNSSVAVGAIDELRARGWLEGENGLLSGASLRLANLHKSDLYNADLSLTDLTQAHLIEVDAPQINLSAATLWSADLTKANLSGANLTGTHLMYAKLVGTNLVGANLTGAYVIGTQLDLASLQNATLPDGTIWKQGIDTGRFVDEEHPEYENSMSKVNLYRLKYGQRLISVLSNGKKKFPLGNERLDYEDMIARVNERRNELGLELWK